MKDVPGFGGLGQEVKKRKKGMAVNNRGKASRVKQSLKGGNLKVVGGTLSRKQE